MKTSVIKFFTGRTFFAFLGILFVTSFAACKKSDNNSPATPSGKSAKFTFTVSGITNSDYVSFVAAGSTGTLNSNTAWKVNGVTRSNEEAISFGNNDFANGTATYVIETATPLLAMSIGIQCLATSTHSYTISYKAEVNGEVKQNEQNVTVSNTQDYTRNFSY
ncbi:hypothetical protein [Taibaiella soli]|uniref:Uncharacterized protein n=1 Tax=Taibaiella soli TaxID=1649169 RepID=A0A2W2B711_9BACT|nr:hypothetical protein [Taibaiella soli]PZF71787.1 hypothetical protein DN068_17125 [Taibaiella soli]